MTRWTMDPDTKSEESRTRKLIDDVFNDVDNTPTVQKIVKSAAPVLARRRRTNHLNAVLNLAPVGTVTLLDLAAWQFNAVTGLVVAGIGLLFLEWRYEK